MTIITINTTLKHFMSKKKDKETVMLILTRRVGETLMVGDEVTVTVLGVKGNQVRIGVNAPKEVTVHREEIYKRIQKEREFNGNQQDQSREDNHQQNSDQNEESADEQDSQEETNTFTWEKIED